jgi:hypothetical protein
MLAQLRWIGAVVDESTPAQLIKKRTGNLGHATMLGGPASRQLKCSDKPGPAT